MDAYYELDQLQYVDDVVFYSPQWREPNDHRRYAAFTKGNETCGKGVMHIV